MPAQRHVFTSESVTEGHPDKIADQISDAVLDAIIAKDPAARVACETLVTTGMAVVAGEITTTTYVHIPDIVRGTISAIGYTDASFGFDAQTCAILTTIDRQSGDIALGVDRGGAGDQGMMFGYASDETASLMPLPIVLAHRLAERLATVRKAGDFPWLRPDGKTQVSVIYEGSRPVGVSKLVVSTQHSDKIDNAEPSTPTAGWRGTAAARSAARTPPKSIARRPTRCAGWRRTSWPRSSPPAARPRSPTRSASPNRSL